MNNQSVSRAFQGRGWIAVVAHLGLFLAFFPFLAGLVGDWQTGFAVGAMARAVVSAGIVLLAVGAMLFFHPMTRARAYGRISVDDVESASGSKTIVWFENDGGTRTIDISNTNQSWPGVVKLCDGETVVDQHVIVDPSRWVDVSLTDTNGEAWSVDIFAHRNRNEIEWRIDDEPAGVTNSVYNPAENEK